MVQGRGGGNHVHGHGSAADGGSHGGKPGHHRREQEHQQGAGGQSGVEGVLTETAAENDEALLDKYFEEGTLTKDEIIHGIRKGIYNINVIPVMAGSALQNKGVINLMNEIVKYLPEAAERAEVPATDLQKDTVIGVTCEEDAPFAAQVFKTAVDPFVGKLNYLRVCRGVLKTGMTVLNPNTNTEERINTIYLVCGKKQVPVTELRAGDIGAVAKLSNTNTGDTLCDENAPVMFDPIPFHKPVLYMAVYAAVRGTEDKVFGGLNRLAEEDKSFTVTKNPDTGETLVGGQGGARRHRRKVLQHALHLPLHPPGHEHAPVGQIDLAVVGFDDHAPLHQLAQGPGHRGPRHPQALGDGAGADVPLGGGGLVDSQQIAQMGGGKFHKGILPWIAQRRGPS